MHNSKKFFKYRKYPKVIGYKFSNKVYILNDNWYKNLNIKKVNNEKKDIFN
jgi:hypothetical protein